MNCIEICGMPEFNFAHNFEAESYKNNFNYLNDRIEISYLVKGESVINCDGVNYHLNPGDITCNLFNKKMSVEAESYHCHHTVSAFVKYRYTDFDFEGLCLPCVVPHTKCDDEIKKIIDTFVYSQHIYINSPTRTANLFLNLLCKIDEASRLSGNFGSGKGEALIYKAKKYISENINTPITQNEIAKFLGISPEYLCSIFKQSENITVMKYINTIKLNNIKILMSEKNLKLYEAASIYGYSDPNYVSLLYKKIFGYNITDVPNNYNADLKNQ